VCYTVYVPRLRVDWIRSRNWEVWNVILQRDYMGFLVFTTSHVYCSSICKA